MTSALPVAMLIAYATTYQGANDMTPTTISRPVEVDTELARIWGLENDQSEIIASAIRQLRWVVETSTERFSGRPIDNREVVRRAEAFMDTDASPYRKADVKKALDKRYEALKAIKVLQDEARPFEDEYATERWSRFFLVDNVDGHIHSSRSCSTTRITTQWSWLPTLSGLTEKDAVDAHGTRLCSVCFPTAPVAWTILPPKVDPNRCPGSGVAPVLIDQIGHRRNNATGTIEEFTHKSPRCSSCGQYFDVTSTNKVRAHKAPKATR